MAEEEGGMVQMHICPHPQEGEGPQAGVVATCTVTAAEALVREAEEVAGEVESLREGVAGIGVEEPLGVAGTRLYCRKLLPCHSTFAVNPLCTFRFPFWYVRPA